MMATTNAWVPSYFPRTAQEFVHCITRVVSNTLVLLLVLVACVSEARQPLTGTLPVMAPLTALAGQEIQVVVGPVDVDNGTPIGMVLVGTYGPRVYNTVFASGVAAFTIPSEHTLQPGYLALIVAVDKARGEASIVLIPNRSASAARPQSATNLVNE